MADEVAPGVWWLHGSRGSNVFLAEIDEGLALIDAGFASSFKGIVRDVERTRPGARVTHVFLTHSHVDHAGAAAAFRQHYGAVVVAGAADCDVGASGTHILREHLGASHLGRRVVRRALARPVAVSEVLVDAPLAGEQRVAGVLAVPTPGHTPGSYCYVLEDRSVAFVGDLVISHRRGLSRPMVAANSDDAEYLRSLQAFASRAPDLGCPGHGRPVQGGFRGQLDSLSDARRRRPWSPIGGWTRVRRMWEFGRATTRLRR